MIYCFNCHSAFAEEGGKEVSGLCPECKSKGIDITKCDKTQCPEYNRLMPNHCEVLRDLNYCKEIKKLKEQVSELKEGILDKVTLIIPREKYMLRRMSSLTCGIFNTDGGEKQPFFTGNYLSLEPIQKLINGAHRLGMVDAAGQLGCDIKKED